MAEPPVESVAVPVAEPELAHESSVEPEPQVDTVSLQQLQVEAVVIPDSTPDLEQMPLPLPGPVRQDPRRVTRRLATLSLVGVTVSVILAMSALGAWLLTTGATSSFAAGSLDGYIPTSASGTRPSAQTCTITWTPRPGIPTGITYDIQDGTGNTLATELSSPPATVPVPAEQATPTVHARLGSWVSLTGTPAVCAQPPDAPASLIVLPTSPTTATATWVLGADHGSVITSTTATVAGGAQTCTASGTGTSCVLGGLQPGRTYVVNVASTSAVGTGPVLARPVRPSYVATALWTGDGSKGQGAAISTAPALPQPVRGGGTYTVVAGSDRHFCGRRTDATLWCWGWNGYGQLGVGDTTQRTTPTQVLPGSTWSAVSTGSFHTCAIRDTGTLWCWGYGYTVGDGSGASNRLTPAQITAATWKSVRVGASHTCAVRSDNTLWCWGNNGDGQLGLGDTGWRQTPVQVTTGSTTWAAAAAGGSHTCAIAAAGSMWCWGKNDAGQLGLGSSASATAPQRVGSLVTWTAVATGTASSCGLQTDATLWCWGSNTTGQLATGDTTNRTAPSRAAAPTTFASVVMGWEHTCARTAAARLLCWGGGTDRRSSGYDDLAHTSPVALPFEPVGSVAAGRDATCAVTDGDLRCWGPRDLDQLGHEYGSAEPMPITGLTDSAQVGVSRGHGCAIDTTGTLRCWGSENPDGRLGTGNTTPSVSPVAVAAGGPWVSVSVAAGHTCAVARDATLWCWGANTTGQLGLGDTTDRMSPTQVGAESVWARVDTTSTGASTAGSTCATRLDGTMWCWGDNTSGQLGTGSSGGLQTSPQQLGTATGWSEVATGGSGFACATTLQGELWCWGEGSQGQLGQGSTSSSATPVRVGAASDWVQLSVGREHVCALTRTSGLACWGDNSRGQLGVGDRVDRSQPVTLNVGTTWRSVAAGGMHTCATNLDDAARCWGASDGGQLGLDGGLDQLTPQVVPAVPALWASAGDDTSSLLTGMSAPPTPTGVSTQIADRQGSVSWSAPTGSVRRYQVTLSPGNASCTVFPPATSCTIVGLTDGATYSATVRAINAMGNSADSAAGSLRPLLFGTLWAFGPAVGGETGLGLGPSRTPLEVDTRSWTSLSQGDAHTCGITGGELWCTGRNNRGQLGIGTQTDTATFTRVGTKTNWRSVTTGGSTYTGFTCATDTANALYCWGDNTSGQLGLGVADTFRTTPSVLTSTWNSAVSAGDAHACAIRSDGRLFCWGANANYELGLGDVTQRSSPTQTSTNTSWSSLDAGASHTCAVRSTGALYCWGLNTSGQLLLNSTSAGTTPQVVSVSGKSWASVTAGWAFSCAITTTGELWCAGSNSDGQLGTGTNNGGTLITRTQISSGTTWSRAAGGKTHMCATTTSGSLYCTGNNGDGALGLGHDSGTASLTQVGTLTWSQPVAGNQISAGILSTGRAATWGRHYDGALGRSVLTMTPQQMGSQSWLSIAGGESHTCGVRADGSLWCWGYNYAGQAGLGSSVPYATTPVRIGTDTDWSSVGAGDTFSCAVKTGGSLWCWGGNDSGVIGQGSTSTPIYWNPVQVPGLTNVKAVAGGWSFGCALRTSGEVYCWGSNGSGQLGDGTTNDRSSPVRAGTTTFRSIGPMMSSVCGVSTSRALVCWGDNWFSQLGTAPDSNPHPTPTQVGTNLTWDTVTSGGGWHSCGLRVDGGVWCWGLDWDGQTGTGAGGIVSTPIRGDTSRTYADITAGRHHTCAARPDGTAFCWGDGNNGAVGSGSRVDIPVPTQIAGATGVRRVFAGRFTSFFLR